MTLYELMNNTTIQGDVYIQPYDKAGRELVGDGFSVKGTEDLSGSCGGKDWVEDWEEYEVNYIYVNIRGVLVIEIQEGE